MTELKQFPPFRISGTDIIPRLSSWDLDMGSSTISGGATDLTIANTANQVGLTINQNDVANGPDAVVINNAGIGNSLSGTGFTFTSTGDLALGDITTPIQLLHASASGADSAVFLLDRNTNNSAGSGFVGRKATGTTGTPGAVASGDTLVCLGGVGYDGTAYASSSSGLMCAIASETFNGTSRGTELTFGTTPNGSTTRATIFTMENDGGLTGLNWNVQADGFISSQGLDISLSTVSTTALAVSDTDINVNKTSVEFFSGADSATNTFKTLQVDASQSFPARTSGIVTGLAVGMTGNVSDTGGTYLGLQIENFGNGSASATKNALTIGTGWDTDINSENWDINHAGALSDGMAATTQASNNNSTLLATTAYVDTAIGGNNELSEILANGNTSGTSDLIMTAGQKITTNNIDSTTGAVLAVDAAFMTVGGATATQNVAVEGSVGIIGPSTTALGTGGMILDYDNADVSTLNALAHTGASGDIGTFNVELSTASGAETQLPLSLTKTGITLNASDGLSSVDTIINADGGTALATFDAGAGTFQLGATTAVDSTLDEDNMVSDSATALATQQSIKAYVDDTRTNFVQASDVTVQSIAVADTFQGVDFGTNDQLDGWTHTVATSTFTCAVSGKYMATMSGFIEKTSGGVTTGSLKFQQNAVDVPGSLSVISIGGNNIVQEVTLTAIFDAVATEVFEPMVTGGATTVQLSGPAGTETSARITITRIN